MLDFNYTLNNELFQYAVRKSAESEAYLEGQRFLLAGGVATQLLLGDEIQLFRPTDDVDIFPEHFVPGKERKKWSKKLSQDIEKKGLPTSRELAENWAQVSFEGLKDNLFIRLNSFTQYYYLGLKDKIKHEFDRAIETEYQGVPVRYQHPIDIIVNKVDRINNSHRVLDIPLEPEAEELLEQLKQGRMGDIDPLKSREDIDAIAAERQLNLEDLGRLSSKEIMLKVQGYKVRKDLYDIGCVIEASRKNGIDIDSQEFKSALELMLEYSQCNDF